MSRIAVVGPSCSGKSSLVQTYVHGSCPETAPKVTLGVDMHTGTWENGDKIYIWDTAGGPSQQHVMRYYLPGCHALMVVYDCTRPDEIQVRDVSKTLASAKDHAQGIDKIPLLVVGTKADLLSSTPKVPPKLDRYMSARNLQHVFASRCNSEQVNAAFNVLLSSVEESIPSPLTAFSRPESPVAESTWCEVCRIS